MNFVDWSMFRCKDEKKKYWDDAKNKCKPKEDEYKKKKVCSPFSPSRSPRWLFAQDECDKDKYKLDKKDEECKKEYKDYDDKKKMCDKEYQDYDYKKKECDKKKKDWESCK